MRRPLHLILAAGPTAPGAEALVARAVVEARGGRPWRVLLTGDGLAWASDEGPAKPLRDHATEVALCARSARTAGVDPDGLPAWIRWSSLVSWLAAAAPEDELWTGLA
jgi:hypothetical protein